MTSPRVAVLTPIRDFDPLFLRQAAESILGQTHEDFEWILVEDGRTAAITDVLAEFADPRIRPIATGSETRTTVSERLNRGMSETDADWIARFDADDVAEPDRLEKQLRWLSEHPSVDVLGSRIRVIDRYGQTLGFRSYPLEHEAIVAALRRYNPIAHPAVIYRRATVLGLGGYRWPGPAQDYELWRRLAQADARFANHPEPLLRYRVHEESVKLRQLRETLRQTLAIKRMYHGCDANLGDRLRMAGERALVWAPERVVWWLFRSITFSSRLSESAEPAEAAR